MTKRTIIGLRPGTLVVLLLAMSVVDAVFAVLAFTSTWPNWPFRLTTVLGTALWFAVISSHGRREPPPAPR